MTAYLNKPGNFKKWNALLYWEQTYSNKNSQILEFLLVY